MESQRIPHKGLVLLLIANERDIVLAQAHGILFLEGAENLQVFIQRGRELRNAARVHPVLVDVHTNGGGEATRIGIVAGTRNHGQRVDVSIGSGARGESVRIVLHGLIGIGHQFRGNQVFPVKEHAFLHAVNHHVVVAKPNAPYQIRHGVGSKHQADPLIRFQGLLQLKIHVHLLRQILEEPNVFDVIGRS